MAEEQEVVVDASVDSAADERDFEAGFAEETNDRQTTTPAKVEETAQPEEKPAEPVVEAPKFAQITVEELEALRANAAELKAAQKALSDNAFGRIGGLKQALDQLAEQWKAENKGPVQVTGEDLAELRAEYPDLADGLVKGLNKVLTKARVSGPTAKPEFDQAQLEQMLADRMTPALKEVETKIEQKFEVKSLDRTHADWRDVVANDKFKDWISKQPDGLADKFYESWDSGFLGKTLQAFKDANKPAPKSEPKPEQSTRARQLAAAVQPRGSGGHATGTTAEDEFMAGFNGR